MTIPGLIVDASTHPPENIEPRTLTPERWKLIRDRLVDYRQVDIAVLNVEAAQEMARELRQCVIDLVAGAQWIDEPAAPSITAAEPRAFAVEAAASPGVVSSLSGAVVSSTATSGKLADAVVALGDQIVSLSKR